MKTKTPSIPVNPATLSKTQILQALRAFVAQRGGIDPRDYASYASYRAESRSVTKDGGQARQLIRAVELSGITAEQLLAACRDAFSGRLQIVAKQQNGETWAVVDYCTGQYFATEYRKAVCAVCASALWHYVRSECMPTIQYELNNENKPGTCEGLSVGDWLRRYFRREYGRAIATRWFD